MYNNIFQFPLGTEVEFTLSRNRIFDNAVLEGKVTHYFKRPGQQTVLQNKRVKFYPVDTVQIETKSGGFKVDVDCIITKPTQAMINEVNRLAEEAIKAKEKKTIILGKDEIKKHEGTFKLADSATITKKIILPYIASKNSKIFHDNKLSTAKRISAKNAVFFKNRAAAEASGRTHAK
jgi:hypothetical protein